GLESAKTPERTPGVQRDEPRLGEKLVGKDPRKRGRIDSLHDLFLKRIRRLEEHGNEGVDPVLHGGEEVLDHRSIHRIDFDRLEGEKLGIRSDGVRLLLEGKNAEIESAIRIEVDAGIERVDLQIDLARFLPENLFPDVVRVEWIAVIIDEVHAPFAAIENDLHERMAREFPCQLREKALRELHSGEARNERRRLPL